MSYYPVNLDIKDRQCLVVGGGAVASRKVKSLMECGADVTVVSPAFTQSLKNLEPMPNMTLVQRSYETHDLEKKFLVIGATDDEKLNRRIKADAENRNMLCNIADVPDICNFILPAIIRRQDLCVTISTSGKSPAFAKKLRKDLEKIFGDEYALFLTLMGEIRKKLLAEEHAPEAHKPIFEKLIAHDLPEMIKNNDKKQVNQVLFEILGSGYDFDALIEGATQKNRL